MGTRPSEPALRFEGKQAKGLGGNEAAGTGWRAGQTFYEEIDDGLGPSWGVIASGEFGVPWVIPFLSGGEEKLCRENIEAAA